jgi:Tfp pilus assembly protein PilN
MRSIAALSRCTNDTVRWARALPKMPDWVVATTYGYTLDEARRVQAVVANLLAELADEAGQ